MVNARNILLWIIGIIFLMSVALNVYHFATESSSSASTSDTTRVTVYDTIAYYQPIPKDSTIVRYVTEVVKVVNTELVTDCHGLDSVKTETNCHQMDSVKVQIPITQKVYEDSTYTAYVSGYKPSLDSIFVYPRKEVQTITNKVNDKSRWSVSVQVGYGLTLTKQPTFSPYVGIGISYNLYTFPRIGKRIKEKLNK